MKILSSLRNRIFLASALVAVFSVAFAIQFVTARVVGEAEADLRRGLQEASALMERHHAWRAQTLRLVARLIADLPPLKAAVETSDPPTVQPVAADYRLRAQADYLAVTDRAGHVLAVLEESDVGRPPDPSAVASALGGREAATFRLGGRGVLEMITVPVAIGPETPEVLGTLSLGFALDDALAGELKGVTQSEVAIVVDGRVVASTLRGLDGNAAARAAASSTPTALWAADDEYVAVSRSLAVEALGGPPPTALIMRSRTARLAFLRTFRTALLAAALVAVAVATVLSYAVARTVTRPLAALMAAMREMSATGDLTRKIRLPTGWHDEDARLLAQTFNTLIDSIARFQREATIKDRLTALGRLSTVIAHEVRNPLMIIKASLRTLRGYSVPSEDVRDAAADIDHEVVRLNRTVEDVLDFARPVRLELGPADLNAVCEEAVTATMVGESAPRCQLELDPTIPPLVTDAERLRTTLVNILSNAREAVQGRTDPADGGGPAEVAVRTTALPGGGAAVTVADRGSGIAPHDLAHIFEPYYTTKRTGTGLGLAIAKNIVDSLGGALHARSEPGLGTEIRLELPLSAPGAREAS